MEKIKIQLTLEELSTLNEALRYANPIMSKRRQRIFDRLRSNIRLELALAVEREESGEA